MSVAQSALPFGLPDALRADAAISRGRGGRLRHAVLVGLDQDHGAGGFFRARSAHQPMSLAQAVTYVWLGQAFLVLLPWNADPELRRDGRTGDVAYERLRPLDTYFFWYARAMAWTIARVVPARLPDVRARGRRSCRCVGLGALAPEIARDARRRCCSSPRWPDGCCCRRDRHVRQHGRVLSMTERGANSLMRAAYSTCSPASSCRCRSFPPGCSRFCSLQPFAGLVDMPFRIYFGELGRLAGVRGNRAAAGVDRVLVFFGHRALRARDGSSAGAGWLSDERRFALYRRYAAASIRARCSIPHRSC